MPYEYYNQFHMTDELETALTNLISEKEDRNYVCKIVSATIPDIQKKSTVIPKVLRD